VKNIDIGLILTGGSSKGAFQVGVLEYLLEKHNIKWISASSVGAINASIIGSGASIDALKENWINIKDKEIFPKKWGFIRRGNIESLGKQIEHNFKKPRIQDCKVPVAIAARSLKNKQEKIFTRGPLLRTTLAACAIHHVFPPVEIDGVPYVDNIVIADYIKNCDKVVIVDLMHTKTHINHPFSYFINKKIQMMQNKRIQSISQKKDIITVRLHKDQNMFDFSKTKELIKKGYKIARSTL
jgi:predicted acylesterase/phospholipase RssA